jgi:CubicO group peptidase (beta-lactamase class C family)
LLLAFATLTLAAPAGALQEQGDPPLPAGPTDPTELEAFVDGVMRVLLEEHNSAGAVVSVVRDGRVFFAKGYGYADREERQEVDPATTLFRIGSVSKLFTWTSVMQMVERSLLDLDTDVNEYLDFEIPETFEKPVTLADIMAHAGGFEDYVVELFGDAPEDVRPLGTILREQLPARVRPAGDLSSYSNHATGMAAYMVERASGTEWIELTEESILEPLGMEFTTFRQPLPDHLAPHMSRGYSYAHGSFHEEEFEYVPMAPVGAAAASGLDMARFMIGHLQLGTYDGRRFLEEGTAQLMQTIHHRMAPGVNGMAHGFMDMSRNGQRIIGLNSEGAGSATGPFVDAFVDRYFPVEEVIVTPPEDFAERADRFIGEYRANRFSHTTLAKLAATAAVSVGATNEGILRALSAEWVEVAPLTFRERYGDETLIFRENEAGEITHFFVASTPIVAFERIPVAEHPTTTFVIGLLFFVTAAVILLSPFVGWAARRWYGVRAHDLARIPGVARLVSWTAAALFAVGVASLVFILRDPTIIAVAVPGSLWVALLIPVVALLPTLAWVALAVQLWRKGWGRRTVRILYSLAAVVFCFFVWQLTVWNLLGWRY